MKKYEDGVHNISNEEYHSSDGISRSALMLLDKSPYHFWYEKLSGLVDKKESTPAMNIGSAFHTLLLEPELFDNEFTVMPKIDRRTKAGKEKYEKFALLTSGKILLTDEQYIQALSMAQELKNHEIVTTLLEGANFEQSIYWTDKETGLQFKTRPDIWSRKMIVDLKTTADANKQSFTRSAVKYGYYLQAGMAFEACRAIGEPFEMFVILAVEKEKPYVPSIFIMKEWALQKGIEKFQEYKTKLKECFDSYTWPGYPIEELGYPDYMIKNEVQNEQ